MITGSEGVSFLLPQLFLSQHRLKQFKTTLNLNIKVHKCSTWSIINDYRIFRFCTASVYASSAVSASFVYLSRVVRVTRTYLHITSCVRSTRHISGFLSWPSYTIAYQTGKDRRDMKHFRHNLLYFFTLYYNYLFYSLYITYTWLKSAVTMRSNNESWMLRTTSAENYNDACGTSL